MYRPKIFQSMKVAAWIFYGLALICVSYRVLILDKVFWDAYLRCLMRDCRDYGL